jgi:hypothetical protein
MDMAWSSFDTPTFRTALLERWIVFGFLYSCIFEAAGRGFRDLLQISSMSN